MNTFKLELNDGQTAVLMTALFDHDHALRLAISNERVCTNNFDTIEIFRSERTRIEQIIKQITTQMVSKGESK